MCNRPCEWKWLQGHSEDEFDDEKIKTKNRARADAEDEIKLQSALRGAAGSGDMPLEPGIIRRGGVRTLAYDITAKMLQQEKDREVPISEQRSEETQENLCKFCGKPISETGPMYTDRCSCQNKDEVDPMGITMGHLS